MPSESSSTKNDTAWQQLFEQYGILARIEQQGHFEIDSATINRVRESRLMTKLDHWSNLPRIFKYHHLSILPLTRGSYVIAPFQAYQDIRYRHDAKPIRIRHRSDLESLDYGNLYSESAALNYAAATGLLAEVLGEACELTVSGRMSSRDFGFVIRHAQQPEHLIPIQVRNAQIEIDGGYEGQTKLALIEAKNTKCEDFLIRQMYYPYRAWAGRISKTVVPIFMTFSNDVFSFFVYEFQEQGAYNSLVLLQQKDFIVAAEPINLGDIKRLAEHTPQTDEPDIPFPQADDFDKVIDLLGLLMNGELSKEEVAINYDFDKRQAYYYFAAARYLGLAEDFSNNDGKERKMRLSADGKRILKLPHKDKNLAFAQAILRHRAFGEALRFSFKIARRPSSDEIIHIMRNCALNGITKESTFHRRAQTVLSWIDWILQLDEEEA
jgi:hypothetical protein